jgi:Ca2+-binding RTX toxin-like protein/LysM repeat protein
MANEDRLIVGFETDSNGKLQITDKTVFDKIADVKLRMTANDYVGHFMDAVAESVNMVFDSQGVKGAAKLATAGQFTFLCVQYNYLNYASEERAKYGDKGLRDEAVALVKTAGNFAFGGTGLVVGSTIGAATGAVAGGVAGAAVGAVAGGGPVGATIVGTVAGTKTAVVTGRVGAIAGSAAGVITFDKVAWFGEGANAKTISDKLGDITRDGWDKVAEKLNDWFATKTAKSPQHVFSIGTPIDTINSVMFREIEVGNDNGIDSVMFGTTGTKDTHHSFTSAPNANTMPNTNIMGTEALNNNGQEYVYTIKSGDTVWGLARKCGISVDELLSMPGNAFLQENRLKDSKGGDYINIKPGQKVVLPYEPAIKESSPIAHLFNLLNSEETRQSKSMNEWTAEERPYHFDGNKLTFNYEGEKHEYYVKSGDTIWGIAKKLGLTVEQLISIPGNEFLQENRFKNNKGEDYILIKPGQTIMLPSTPDQSSPTAEQPTKNVRENKFVKVALDAIEYAMSFESPLVLDLDGDGIELSHVFDNAVFFDIDNDGHGEKIGWVKPDDAHLAIDVNGNGQIDNITELYGDDVMPAFKKLALHDSNKDGIIDAHDHDFNKILVWRDLNQNGVSEPGELKTLAETGIASISLDEKKVEEYNQDNLITGTSIFTWKDGRTGTVADVHYINDQVNSWYVGKGAAFTPLAINMETLYLPALRGYGTLPSLHIAMSKNDKLLNMVKEFSELPFTRLEEVNQRIEEILYEWAGVTDVGVESRTNSFGIRLDARKVGFIEKFSGKPYQQVGNDDYVGVMAGFQLLYSYHYATLSMRHSLMIQGPLKEIFPNASYNIFTDKISLNISFKDAIAGAKLAAKENGMVKNNNDVMQIMYDILGRNIKQLGEPYPKLFQALDEIQWVNTNLDRMLLDMSKFYNCNKIMLLSSIGDVEEGSDLNEMIFAGGGDDSVWGKGGNDVIFGESGNDYLSGGEGNDKIYGGYGNDFLLGDEGDDTIHGEQGDDIIVGGFGADNMDGGEGSDTLCYADAKEGIYVNLATGIASGDISTQGDVFVNFENLHGSLFNDTLIGDEKDNFINGEAGDDHIEGGDGNDTLFGASGNDVLQGGNGNDTIAGGRGGDKIDGGEGFDTLQYSSYYDTEGVYVNLSTGEAKGGEAEGDTFSNIEAVSGSKFNDILIGDRNKNVLLGGKSDDILFGNGGNDALSGQEGSDTFIIMKEEGSSATILDFDTYKENDKIIVVGFKHISSAKDILLKNSLLETLSLPVFAKADTTLISFFLNGLATFDLGGGQELILKDAQLKNFSNLNFESYNHSDFAQIKILTHKDDSFVADKQEHYLILAENGDDQVEGNSGDDEIHGGLGNDTIKGGAGNDLIYGDEGDDNLYGGLGADIFAYKLEVANGNDTIHDFNVTEDILRFINNAGSEITTQSLRQSVTANISGDAVFDMNGWSVTLIGIKPDQLSDNNFALI